LTKLHIEKNKIISLVGITFPPCLERLHLQKNQITSLKNVVFPISLKYLKLGHNEISDLEGIDFPFRLQVLYLENNPLNNIKKSNIFTLIYMYNFYYSLNNEISDFEVEKLMNKSRLQIAQIVTEILGTEYSGGGNNCVMKKFPKDLIRLIPSYFKFL
jgi:Leucine-rich repeat (LRR) protein